MQERELHLEIHIHLYDYTRHCQHGTRQTGQILSSVRVDELFEFADGGLDDVFEDISILPDSEREYFDVIAATCKCESERGCVRRMLRRMYSQSIHVGRV